MQGSTGPGGNVLASKLLATDAIFGSVLENRSSVKAAKPRIDPTDFCAQYSRGSRRFLPAIVT